MAARRIIRLQAFCPQPFYDWAPLPFLTFHAFTPSDQSSRPKGPPRAGDTLQPVMTPERRPPLLVSSEGTEQLARTAHGRCPGRCLYKQPSGEQSLIRSEPSQKRPPCQTFANSLHSFLMEAEPLPALSEGYVQEAAALEDISYDVPPEGEEQANPPSPRLAAQEGGPNGGEMLSVLELDNLPYADSSTGQKAPPTAAADSAAPEPPHIHSLPPPPPAPRFIAPEKDMDLIVKANEAARRGARAAARPVPVAAQKGPRKRVRSHSKPGNGSPALSEVDLELSELTWAKELELTLSDASFNQSDEEEESESWDSLEGKRAKAREGRRAEQWRRDPLPTSSKSMEEASAIVSSPVFSFPPPPLEDPEADHGYARVRRVPAEPPLTSAQIQALVRKVLPRDDYEQRCIGRAVLDTQPAWDNPDQSKDQSDAESDVLRLSRKNGNRYRRDLAASHVAISTADRLSNEIEASIDRIIEGPQPATEVGIRCSEVVAKQSLEIASLKLEAQDLRHRLTQKEAALAGAKSQRRWSLQLIEDQKERIEGYEKELELSKAGVFYRCEQDRPSRLVKQRPGKGVIQMGTGIREARHEAVSKYETSLIKLRAQRREMDALIEDRCSLSSRLQALQIAHEELSSTHQSLQTQHAACAGFLANETRAKAQAMSDLREERYRRGGPRLSQLERIVTLTPESARLWPAGERRTVRATLSIEPSRVPPPPRGNYARRADSRPRRRPPTPPRPRDTSRASTKPPASPSPPPSRPPSTKTVTPLPSPSLTPHPS